MDNHMYFSIESLLNFKLCPQFPIYNLLEKRG